MPVSVYFQDLAQNCASLEAKFITQQLQHEITDFSSFTADTEYLAAFRFLVHAEIEDYLERKARNHLDILKTQVKINPRPNISSVPWAYRLCSFFDITLPKEYQFKEASFFGKVDEAITRAEEALSKNNGIKGESFKLSAFILGYELDELDQGLIIMLNAFGEARGNIAHRGLPRVRQTINLPSVEKGDVDNIIAGLKNFFHEN
ncbi:hypothetical protein [Pseudomonas sp. NPDC089741]|uniref:hypothetical protein n=1 Tax=Pseudomonas sp. NPDC089741 TaxID=3364470 RepID=UPI003810D626